jgi:NADH/NAD ratio-sensing transcriptional regulator Rex
MIPASANADVSVDLSPSANNIISVQFKRSGSTVETMTVQDLEVYGAKLAAMQTALEALNLPAQMLTTATTDRLVIRGIMAIFSVAQCMQGKGFNIFSAGVTLSTQLSALPVAARQALQDCAAFLGYDETGITLASTVRQLLTKLVQQASPSPMLGVTV